MATAQAQKIIDALQSMAAKNDVSARLEAGSDSGNSSDLWLAPSISANIPVADGLTLSPSVSTDLYQPKYSSDDGKTYKTGGFRSTVPYFRLGLGYNF
jgi:hypothetical protein